MPLKKLLLEYAALAILITVLLVIAKGWGRHTASFNQADSFIRTNPVVSKRLGVIDATSLSSYKFEMCRDGGSCAEFEIVAIGHAARGAVRVYLQKGGSEWEVTSASLILRNGDTVLLK